MKDYIKVLLVLIVMYLCVAYITLQPNPLKWEESLRVTISIITFLITLFGLLGDKIPEGSEKEDF